MNAPMTEEEAAARLAALIAEREAEQDAARARRKVEQGVHVRRAPAKKVPAMSGPRYFNLMRAMESNPDAYAEYRPTNYCGAPLTEFDWSRRSALAKKNVKAVAEDGVCTRCLVAAADDTGRTGR